MLNASRPAPPVKGGALQAHDGSLHPQTRMAHPNGGSKSPRGVKATPLQCTANPSGRPSDGRSLQDRELAAPRSEVGVGASPPRTLPTARPLVSPLQLSPRTLPRASAVPSPLQCGSFPRLEEPCRHCRWPPCLSGQCEREWRDLAAAVQKDELTVRRMIVPRSVTRSPQTRALPMRLRLGGQLPKRKSANQLRPSAMAARHVGQMSRTLGCPEGGHR